MAENTNFYVIDTSVVIALLAPDERNQPLAKKVAELVEDPTNLFYAPELQQFEVLNSLKSMVASGRLSQAGAFLLIETFKKWKRILVEIELNEVFELALKTKLTAYDASYLWLARKMHAKLITKDEELLFFSPLPKEWNLS